MKKHLFSILNAGPACCRSAGASRQARSHSKDAYRKPRVQVGQLVIKGFGTRGAPGDSFAEPLASGRVGYGLRQGGVLNGGPSRHLHIEVGLQPYPPNNFASQNLSRGTLDLRDPRGGLQKSSAAESQSRRRRTQHNSEHKDSVHDSSCAPHVCVQSIPTHLTWCAGDLSIFHL